MVAFAGRAGVFCAVVRADAKQQLRIGSKPNADRGGGWPMSIIRYVYFLEAEC
jgi:hypothetical protein